MLLRGPPLWDRFRDQEQELLRALPQAHQLQAVPQVPHQQEALPEQALARVPQQPAGLPVQALVLVLPERHLQEALPEQAPVPPGQRQAWPASFAEALLARRVWRPPPLKKPGRQDSGATPNAGRSSGDANVLQQTSDPSSLTHQGQRKLCNAGRVIHSCLTRWEDQNRQFEFDSTRER